MGFDLKLLVPYVEPHGSQEILGQEKVLPFAELQLIRHYDILGQMVDLGELTEVRPCIETMPVPDALKVRRLNSEVGASWEHCDDARKELCFTYAKEFSKINLGEAPHPINQAVMAYLAALPPDTPIILWGAN